MLRSTRFIAGLCLASLALAVAACGEATVEKSSVEDEIKKEIEASGEKASSVECPDDIKAKKGTSVNCTYKLEGADAEETVKVTQVDDEGKFKTEFPQQGGEEGAGGDDEATIRGLFAELDKDPTQTCTELFATEDFIEQAGGQEECDASAAEEEPGGDEVTSVEVAEDGTAVAVITDEDGETTINLVSDEEGGWFLDSVEE